MITKEKINELFKKSDDRLSDLRYGGNNVKLEGYTFEYIFDKRAYNGGSPNYTTLVIKVSQAGKPDTFWMDSGYYDSYNGVDWNRDFKQVKLVTKTIEVYE